LLASIIASFIFGAITGTMTFANLPGFALMVPALFLGWIILLDWRMPIAGVRELDPLTDAELKRLGIVNSFLPPELGIWRISCRRDHIWHKAPDFAQWAEKIPAKWRVMILALSPLTHFNNNAILGLEVAMKKLNDQGRRLILAGITPAQYRTLTDCGIARFMALENLCPDLEFAVARGIDLAQTMRPATDERKSPVGSLGRARFFGT
jgi:anti-anti-sigma regulatory factor